MLSDDFDFDEYIKGSQYKNIPLIIDDEFNDSKNIEWLAVSSSLFSNEVISRASSFNFSFTFGFNFLNSKDFIVFSFNPKEIQPKKGDEVIFLFENEQQMKFIFDIDPVNIKNRKGERELQYKSLITESELHLFLSVNFKKWKIILNNERREILGGDMGSDDYTAKDNLIIVIKKFTRDYIETVKENIPDYKPLKIREQKLSSSTELEACYVYLMRDFTNDFYKIGISNSPEYRERTLQSEKPTIEMVIAKRFPVRKIAESFEKALHESYSEKRIRGEWFNLNNVDVSHIIESLK